MMNDAIHSNHTRVKIGIKDVQLTSMQGACVAGGCGDGNYAAECAKARL